MATRYRGDDSCIFKDVNRVGGFCEWHSSMKMKLGLGDDPLDSLEICRLCTEQNHMKTVSFISSLVKDIKQAFERGGKMRGL